MPAHTRVCRDWPKPVCRCSQGDIHGAHTLPGQMGVLLSLSRHESCKPQLCYTHTHTASALCCGLDHVWWQGSLAWRLLANDGGSAAEGVVVHMRPGSQRCRLRINHSTAPSSLLEHPSRALPWRGPAACGLSGVQRHAGPASTHVLGGLSLSRPPAAERRSRPPCAAAAGRSPWGACAAARAGGWEEGGCQQCAAGGRSARTTARHAIAAAPLPDACACWRCSAQPREL